MSRRREKICYDVPDAFRRPIISNPPSLRNLGTGPDRLLPGSRILASLWRCCMKIRWLLTLVVFACAGAQGNSGNDSRASADAIHAPLEAAITADINLV